MSGGNGLARVSVIIPTYNCSNLLRFSIESVLTQTYPNVEIIVVDDGSTDDTATVMEQYAGQVTYIKQANQGSPAATNTGIRAASGEYLTFLDHDDLMMPTKIEHQVQVLDSRPEIGLVHCGYYHIDKDGNLLDRVSLLPEGDVLKQLVCGDFIWAGAPLIRRQCLDRVGLFDEEMWCEDWDLWLRIALTGYRFACVQEPLGAYRILPSSKVTNALQVERGVLAVLDKFFASPQLPADVVVLKGQAYGTMRCWVSFRYYTIGLWDEAQRNLAAALALYPQMLEPPEDILQALYGHALSPHVGDPIKFVTGVFDHLPPVINGLHRYRSQMLSQVHVGLALRNYGLGGMAVAKNHLTEAIDLDPVMLEQMDRFAELLCHNAMSLPIGAPLQYVETVLQSLPPVAQPLERVRSRVLGDVSVACAFQDHFAGRRSAVVRHIMTALRNRPFVLRNRGVTSIFLKSLLGIDDQRA